MCKNKHAIKGSLLHFVAFAAAVFVSTLIGGNAFAATTDKGIITDPDTDIRWEYELVTDTNNAVEPQVLTIRFYDKPATETTVTVPSLSDLISLVPNATNDLDTYFLKDADAAAQNTAYGASHPRRTPEMDTTVLDMTSTSKIQIRGVKPIIDPAVETELIFGENMVIGDTFERGASTYVYNRVEWYESYWGGWWNTYGGQDVELDFESIPGWKDMTLAEKINYKPTIADFGCIAISDLPHDYVSEEGKCYIYGSSDSFISSTLTFHGGAFSGYRLKLTNFEEENFNYIGYQAFKDSILDDAHTTMTITGDAFTGGFIFQNTNIEKAIINTNTYGTGLFKDCQSLTEFTIGNGVDHIEDDTFAATGLGGSISFANMGIKTIGARAFEDDNFTEINFESINRINYAAFRNNDLRELYLPKSINYLQSYLFENNDNIKKLTVAYDTLTSGTTLPLWVVISGHYDETSNDPVASIEEVNVIAPYAANEPVSATHVTYDDYRWGFNTWNQEHTGGSQPNGWGYNSYGTVYHGDNTYKFEDDYADVDSKKNIIAPLYFAMFKNLKKITIGEGYEYVGSSAFWHTYHTFVQWPTQQKPSGLCDGSKEIYDSEQGWIWVDYENEKCNVADESRYLEEINLPSTLKGVGNLSFEGSLGINMKVNLPDSLEFIGIAAFGCLYHMGGDFDLPNVKYIGDFAFNGTSLRDIAVHNTVVYWGDKAFSNIPTLRNITLDVDLFDPDRIIPWTRVNDPTNYDPCHGEQYFRMQFGEFEGRSFSNRYGGITPEVLYERWGIREVDTQLIGSILSRFGKITFTENVVHMMPQMDQYADSSSSWDAFFGYTTADEVDMSAMPWKILPRKFFNRTEFGKVTLPQNLEIIGHHAFVSTIIDEELVIPDSVKIIGAYAFESWENISCRSYRWDSELQKNVCTAMPVETIKITKLPTSLEYVGYLAFWGDRNLTADLNAPNLKFIGSRAFMNTGIRDVLLPNGLSDLREAAFAMNPNLRNITIDVNLSDIYTSQSERDGLETYSYPEYFLEWAGSFETASVEINSTYQHSRCDYYDEQLADGYYDQHPDYLQYADDACKEERPFQTFYTIFNQHIETLQDRWGYDYEAVKVNQNESGDTYGTLTFGPHATTELDSMIGAFSGLTFEKVDLSQTGWKKLTENTDAFYESKIGTLILPRGLEIINYASFMKAEVTNPITIPASVRTIDTSAFQWAKIGGLDIKEGLTTINSAAFQSSEIGGEFSLPNSLRTINWAAFQWGKGKITNLLPEGVETVDGGAFFDADWADELTIPSTLTSLSWGAFNAENNDVSYDKVTVKPADFTAATSQLIHQMLWKNKVKELVVESGKLNGANNPDNEHNEEFYNMTIEKVRLDNIPVITRSAFYSCDDLEEVDMSRNANIRNIMRYAFDGDAKLHIIKFSPSIKNQTVTLGTRAFAGTGFETMTDASSDFDLSAANFDATDSTEVFAEMPSLRLLSIPNGFSNNTIPATTFKNDPKLKEVTVGYKITQIGNEAFSNDILIEKIFIWGNTVVVDDDFAGYEEPDWFGRGGDDDDNTTGTSVDSASRTIPGQADIYAYSVSPTEAYASYSRDAFTGTFYPLDEVLYLTSNKPTVLLNDDETDFDKSNLIVYGLRRDGVVLESDSWAEYDGVAYARSARPLTFEKMAATIEADPAFGTVYDTPVPLAELDFGNENFAEIDFAIVPAQDDPAVRIVNIVYTDGYTRGEPDTDIDPRKEQEPEPEPHPEPETPETPETPKTNDDLGKYVALLTGSVAAGLGLIGWNLIRRNRR